MSGIESPNPFTHTFRRFIRGVSKGLAAHGDDLEAKRKEVGEHQENLVMVEKGNGLIINTDKNPGDRPLEEPRAIIEYVRCASMIIREIEQLDLESILSIQSECYKDVQPENPASIEAKIKLNESACYLATKGDAPVGYILSHPFEDGEVPVLNCILEDAPYKNPVFYIHDLAVSRAGRGLGIGRKLVEQVLRRARDSDFKKINLIAVQGSVPFWENFSFCCVDDFDPVKLLSYGKTSRFMSLKNFE